MPEPPDYQAAIDAAEAAAERGDMTNAADAFRRAAELQTAALGPAHPDLANTLNNLGVVAERLGWFEVAEASYRRANTIAEAALPPDHPFVETSRRNLRDFCALQHIPLAPDAPKAEAAERKPIEKAAPAPAPVPSLAETTLLAGPSIAPSPTPAEPPVSAEPVLRRPDLVETPEPIAPASRGRAPLMAGVIAVALLATWFLVQRNERPSSPEAQSTPPDAVASAPAGPATKPAAPETAPPAASAPALAASTPGVVKAPTVTSAPTPAPTAAPPPPSTVAPPSREPARTPPQPEPFPRASVPAPRTDERGVSVVDARLCRTLDTHGREWTCAAPAEPAPAGVLYFLTRVVTPRDLAMEHRWYRGETLVRSKKISVPASGAPGYRAYSQQVVDGKGGAEWRVDLVTRDGRVLQSARFGVR